MTWDLIKAKACKGLKDATTYYKGEKANLMQHLAETGIGLGACYVIRDIIEGPQPIMGAMALGYTLIKLYQTAKDFKDAW